MLRKDECLWPSVAEGSVSEHVGAACTLNWNPAAFEQNDYDLAIIVDQGASRARAFQENAALAWLAAPHLDIAKEESVPLAFLTEGRDLRKYAISALDRAARTYHVAHLSSNRAGVRALVAAGLAVTIAPAFARDVDMSGMTHVSTLPDPGDISFSCYLGPRRRTPELEALCGYVQEEFRRRESQSVRSPAPT